MIEGGGVDDERMTGRFRGQSDPKEGERNGRGARAERGEGGEENRGEDWQRRGCARERSFYSYSAGLIVQASPCISTVMPGHHPKPVASTFQLHNYYTNHYTTSCVLSATIPLQVAHTGQVTSLEAQHLHARVPITPPVSAVARLSAGCDEWSGGKEERIRK